MIGPFANFAHGLHHDDDVGGGFGILQRLSECHTSYITYYLMKVGRPSLEIGSRSCALLKMRITNHRSPFSLPAFKLFARLPNETISFSLPTSIRAADTEARSIFRADGI